MINKMSLRRVVMALAALWAVSSSARAAEPPDTQYVSSADSGKVTIDGTSTLHNWTVTGTGLNGKVAAGGAWKADAGPNVEIKSIDLTIPVNSLKSTEGGGMDNNMYTALKSKQNANITYHLIKASLKTSPSKEDPAYHFDAVGQLTVAGAQRPLELDVGVLRGDDGRLTVSTETTLQMTDFGVPPPTAMLGMIKSGNTITVKATWQLTPQTPAATP